jgi:Protein of unknown function (DUF433)
MLNVIASGKPALSPLVPALPFTVWSASGSPSTRPRCGAFPASGVCVSRLPTVLGQLAAGQTEAEILATFPDLESEDIKAALKYAAAGVKAV